MMDGGIAGDFDDRVHHGLGAALKGFEFEDAQGPFQTMVLARLIASVKILFDSGPESKPSQPSGMPVASVALPRLQVSENHHQ